MIFCRYRIGLTIHTAHKLAYLAFFQYHFQIDGAQSSRTAAQKDNENNDNKTMKIMTIKTRKIEDDKNRK